MNKDTTIREDKYKVYQSRMIKAYCDIMEIFDLQEAGFLPKEIKRRISPNNKSRP